MLLKRQRCRICKNERSVRPCPRRGGKEIGWSCCNELRRDLNCPAQCSYAPRKDASQASPIPAFKADSNTEFQQAMKLYLDLWIKLPNPALEGRTPLACASEDAAALFGWLEKFQYPANFPMTYLLDKLSLAHAGTPEPESPETVAMAFLDDVIAQEWDQLRRHTANDRDYPGMAKLYGELLSSIPLLRRLKHYRILHAGAGDDGISALVMLELNHKDDWSMILSSAQGSWRVKQNFKGSPELYYRQNKLFHQIAGFLSRRELEASWDSISGNLEFFPDCADLYYYRALYWQLQKEAEKCAADLKTAIALDNYFTDAIFALAVLYMQQRRPEEAVPWLRAVQSLAPEHLDAQNNLAACLAELGDIKAAIALWQEILTRNPSYEPARKNLDTHST